MPSSSAGLLRVRPSVQIVPTELGYSIVTEQRSFCLEGEDVAAFVASIIPLLNGMHDRATIVSQLRQYTPKSINELIDTLLSSRVIEEIDHKEDESTRHSSLLTAHRLFFQNWSASPGKFIRKIAKSKVLLAGTGNELFLLADLLIEAGIEDVQLMFIDPQVLTSGEAILQSRILLQAKYQHARIRSTVIGSPAELQSQELLSELDLLVIYASKNNLHLISNVVNLAHQIGLPYITVANESTSLEVGPIVLPGKTACWECSRLRQLANTENPKEEHSLQTSLLSNEMLFKQVPTLSSAPNLAAAYATSEIIKLLSGFTPSMLVGKILSVNLINLSSTIHSIIRMPWCELCGGAVLGVNRDSKTKFSELNADSIPVNLADCESSQELRSRLEGWVDEKTGIIKYLGIKYPEITDPQEPYTATAISRSSTNGAFANEEPLIGSGKGFSQVQAMIGAVGEAIERYSASQYREADLVRSSATLLMSRGQDYFDPKDLCLYSDAQYATPGFPYVPFDDQMVISWTEGLWLDRETTLLIPALPAYFNYHAPPRERFCQVTSSGLACGPDVVSAALSAILELIERDAFMLSWLCQLQGKLIDDSILMSENEKAVIRELNRLGADLAFYLLDAGIGIPVIACIGWGDGKKWPGATVSVSAHLDCYVAMRKALLEQAHVGPYISRLSREASQKIPSSPNEVHNLLDHALYYVPAERKSAFEFLGSNRTILNRFDTSSITPASQLRIVSERLREAGVRAAIVDVTSPDLCEGPFKVVRAFGTCLQPIDFGHSNRRLANPRIRELATHTINPNPHPIA